MTKQFVEGTIDKISVKDTGEEDQYGNRYFLNLIVNGELYGMGKKKQGKLNVKDGSQWYSLKEGDKVEFAAEQNEKGYWAKAKNTQIELKEKGGGNGQGESNSTSGQNNGGHSNGNSNNNNGGHSDYEVGMTVGHAITSAINILPAKEAKEEEKVYEQAAKIIRLSMRMKEDMRAGQFDEEPERKNEESNQVNQQIQEDDFDDQIPF